MPIHVSRETKFKYYSTYYFIFYELMANILKDIYSLSCGLSFIHLFTYLSTAFVMCLNSVRLLLGIISSIMYKYKRILAIFTIVFVIITSLLGILLISDVISSTETTEVVIKGLQIVAVLTVASTIIMVISEAVRNQNPKN